MASDPILNVRIISTGSVRIRPAHEHADWRPTMLWLASSRTWTAPRPIHVYVIEHRDGLVLFDTGQDRRSVTEDDYFPSGITGWLYDRLASFDINENATLPAQLASLGLDAEQIHTVVLSHLHQDHIGGLRDLPAQAEVVIRRAEHATLEARAPELAGVLVRHIRLPGIRWRVVDDEPFGPAAMEPFDVGHDVMGDGSLLLVPTPGHTPGSGSLIVRRAGKPPLILVGDLTYDAARMPAGVIPGVGDRPELRRSTAQVLRFAEHHPGTAVLAAHDPAAAELLARSDTQATRRRL